MPNPTIRDDVRLTALQGTQHRDRHCPGRPGVLQPCPGLGAPALSAVRGRCKGLPRWPPGPRLHGHDNHQETMVPRVVHVPRHIT